SLVAPCQPGASPASVQRRTCTTGLLNSTTKSRNRLGSGGVKRGRDSDCAVALILIALICASLAQRIVFTVAVLRPRRRRGSPASWPRVQIFVAARDEETALPRLLQSFDQLDYPDHLSFVLVNDGSTDAT